MYISMVSKAASPRKVLGKLWLWMARNKMNVTAYRPYTAAFQKKLGMSFRMGGHIFERILNPDQEVEGDRTLWDVHRDWYGKKNGMLPEDKALALKTQFCMSNREFLFFLSEKLLDNLNGEWYDADRIDLWHLIPREVPVSAVSARNWEMVQTRLCISCLM